MTEHEKVAYPRYQHNQRVPGCNRSNDRGRERERVSSEEQEAASGWRRAAMSAWSGDRGNGGNGEDDEATIIAIGADR